jgi:hypothetical protein
VTKKQRSPLVRVLRNVGGILLLLLGIVGLFLPVLQGWLFIVLGLGLIDLPIKHRLHQRAKRWRWYRWISERYMRFKRSMKRWREKRRAARAARSPARQPQPGEQGFGTGGGRLG